MSALSACLLVATFVATAAVQESSTKGSSAVHISPNGVGKRYGRHQETRAKVMRSEASEEHSEQHELLVSRELNLQAPANSTATANASTAADSNASASTAADSNASAETVASVNSTETANATTEEPEGNMTECAEAKCEKGFYPKFCTRTSTKCCEKEVPGSLNGTDVYLQGPRNIRWCFGSPSDGLVTCSASDKSDELHPMYKTEEPNFHFEFLPDAGNSTDNFAIMSKGYVCGVGAETEPYQHALYCAYNRTDLAGPHGHYGRFAIVHAGNGKIAFKASNEKYCSDEIDGIMCGKFEERLPYAAVEFDVVCP